MISLGHLILAALLFIGIRLILQGRRGKRIDDHPVCIRCKFDLSGRSQPSGRCPECGAYVDQRHGAEIGNRKRQDGLIVGGLAFSLFGGVPLVAELGARVLKIDPIRFEPTAWLLRDAVKDPDYTRQRDFAELLARVKDAKISETDIKNLVKLALDQQADPTKTWNSQWGDMIESLHGNGQLSATDWKTYLDHDQLGTLEIRPHIARGDPIPYHYQGELRGATPIQPVRSHGPTFTGTIPGCSATVLFASSFWGNSFELDGNLGLTPADWDLLKPGPQTLLANIKGQGRANSANPTYFAPINVVGNWTLLKNGEKSVELYHDEALAARVEALLTCHAYARKDDVTVDVSCESPPADVAFDVFIKTPAAEYKSNDCWVSFARNQQHGAGTANFGSIPGLAGKHADIFFRPSIPAAARTVHMDKLLDHEFVIRDVLIEELH